MTNIIYGLFDPRNQELRYVGHTIQNLAARLKGHINDKENNYKISWIKSLKKLGLKPEISILEFTNEQNWKEDEQWHIQYWRFLGARLTNLAPGGEGFVAVPKGSKIDDLELCKQFGPERKTTEEQDKEINRKYWEFKIKPNILAKEYSVDRATIHRIVRGRINKFDEKKPKVEQNKLTREQVLEVRKLSLDGRTASEINNIMNIQNTNLSRIINKKVYRNI